MATPSTKSSCLPFEMGEQRWGIFSWCTPEPPPPSAPAAAAARALRVASARAQLPHARRRRAPSPPLLSALVLGFHWLAGKGALLGVERERRKRSRLSWTGLWACIDHEGA
jgi:hypothetical protein